MFEQPQSPNSASWWLSDGNNPTGPHSESSLLAGIKRGRISPLSYACPVGGQDWRLVCEWPAFVQACAAVGTVVQSPQVVTTQAGLASVGKVQQKAWSGLGLSSLIIAAAGFFFHLVAVSIAAVAVTNGATGAEPIMICAGLVMVVTLVANFLGAVLGVIALVESAGHKWMAVVGLVGNLFEILGLVGLIVLGTTMG
jgi:uncharacterized protein with PQ loop repeat